MAKNSYIRIKSVDAHLDARTVNPIIEDVLVKRAISITQKPYVRKQIGEAFVDVVTPFVPYKSGKLSMQGGATNDGRVFWSATNKGFDYASYVYDEYSERWGPAGYVHPTRGKSPDPNHDPQPRWVERVHPGTKEWSIFIDNITPIIKEAFAKDE